MKTSGIAFAFILLGFFITSAQQWSGNDNTTDPISRTGIINLDGYSGAQIRLNSTGTYYGKIGNPMSQVWSLGWGDAGLAINPVLSWTANGFVGIGTNSPQVKLDVQGDVAWGGNGAMLKIDQGAAIELKGTGYPYIDFSNDAGSDYDMRLILNGDDELSIMGGRVSIGLQSTTAKVAVENIAGASGVNVIGTLTKTHGDGAISYAVYGEATTAAYVSGTYTAGVYGYSAVTDHSAGVYSNGKCASTAGFVSASDARLKSNIKNATSGLDVILKLTPKEYTFRHDFGINFPQGNQVGFLAQDVEKILPHLVSPLVLPHPDKPLPNDDYLSMDYVGIIPYLVKSIQEQQELIKNLTTMVETLSGGTNIGTGVNPANDVGPAMIGSIYPNPSNEIFEVAIDNVQSNETYDLQIVDKSGNTIYKAASAQHKTIVDTQGFPNGTYIVILYVNGKPLDTKRVNISR